MYKPNINNTDQSNIPQTINDKRCVKLHNKKYNPICLIKERIYYYFENSNFQKFDDLHEVVTVENNFDLLLIPTDHPSRSKSDTYYVNNNEVLRTHTSAHQNELLSNGETRFLVTGDVYRKDEIDRFHYPVFHQMEGVCVVENDIDPEKDLKNTLSKLVEFLFPNKQYRFNSDYFPFTNPSYEIEVLFGEKWVEILGCGVVQSKILEHNNINKKAWAFGLGLERLAMILYSIPDIRLFWTNDEKFLSQFENHNCLDNITFIEYSKIPSITMDISFWLSSDDVSVHDDKKIIWKKQNDFMDIVRTCMDTNIEKVELVDEFYHPKKQQYSHCWRMTLNPSTNISDPAIFHSLCVSQMTILANNLKENMQLTVR